jgi:hypothetical protein
MAITSFKIDSYSVQLFALDRKGKRTRWGNRIIHLYSGGKNIAQAVFGDSHKEIPEPTFNKGKIFYYAEGSQYPDVLDLLRREKTVYIAWQPIHDPKEPNDGDAYFYTDHD